MAYQDPHVYNAPPGSLNDPPSTVGKQIRTDYFYKKALIDAAKEQYFGQMADVRSMPKNMGKTIKQYHYLPILDDRNINDQGIDVNGNPTAAGGAAGGVDDAGASQQVILSITMAEGGRDLYAKFLASTGTANDPAFTYGQQKGTGDTTWPAYNHPYLPEKIYFSGTAVVGHKYPNITAAGASGTSAAIADGAGAAAAAKTMAVGKVFDFLSWLGITATVTAIKAVTTAAPVKIGDITVTAEMLPDGTNTSTSGNLYGSSKDVGTIMGKMPTLSETGGRVNRVGMKRIEITGSLEKFGFFDEYTQESLDFDTDAELEGHITSESVKAANEITEDQLQIDLLHSAGVIRYAGSATSMATLSGDTDGATNPRAKDVVSYDDLIKLSIELDNNRTPKNTKVITGSRMIDTRVVNAARYMYIGSELLPTFMRMKDYHGEAAYIPVAQYGAATTIARGEVGAVGDFRLIVVPEMMHWEGAGGAVSSTPANVLSHNNGANYDVYPCLVVGDGAFTTIGFQTDGKTVKFVITHKRPGKDMADRSDPYGEVGFYSIKWYYGFMPLRPERIALIKTVAEY